MTFIQALKDLAYKVTGKTPTSNTENGVLAEFASDYQTGSGGGSGITVVCEYDSTNYTYTANKTYGEIFRAVSAGESLFIIVHMKSDGDDYYNPIHVTRLRQTSNDTFYINGYICQTLSGDNHTKIDGLPLVAASSAEDSYPIFSKNL